MSEDVSGIPLVPRVALSAATPRSKTRSGVSATIADAPARNGLRVLVACEFSGVVRDELIALGHDAMSCDLLPSERPGPHYTGDVRDVLNDGWDMMIAFPPCTHLCSSGARWFAEKRVDGRQQAAIDFFLMLVDANIPRIAIENPVGIMSRAYRKPDQIIQPWQFGEEATKTTCLWLKGLPLLVPTNIVSRGDMYVTKSGRRMPKWYNMAPSEDRGKKRSITFPGIARAMAGQWGGASAIEVESPQRVIERGLETKSAAA